jgi:hypothetical protein
MEMGIGYGGGEGKRGWWKEAEKASLPRYLLPTYLSPTYLPMYLPTYLPTLTTEPLPRPLNLRAKIQDILLVRRKSSRTRAGGRPPKGRTRNVAVWRACCFRAGELKMSGRAAQAPVQLPKDRFPSSEPRWRSEGTEGGMFCEEKWACSCGGDGLKAFLTAAPQRCRQLRCTMDFRFSGTPSACRGDRRGLGMWPRQACSSTVQVS